MESGAQKAADISDEHVVRQFVETHDTACFAELFARHRKRIYFACRGFFENGSAAEDATQETFLRAFQNMDRFQDGNFCAWLMRIAKNVCIDQWRKQRPEVGADELQMENLAADGALDERADLRIAVEKVRKEMEALTPEQCRCLEMAIEGYSYEETATRTGLSIKAVKSHIQNGRRMLWLKMEGTLSQLK
ncbi:MAG: sigma-70 family RNA polymerase sigma factor [Candidatus Korobacteraceae bacterium]|jgi:RNA polymerase sigma-70 factor (ECF subfamily)